MGDKGYTPGSVIGLSSLRAKEEADKPKEKSEKQKQLEAYLSKYTSGGGSNDDGKRKKKRKKREARMGSGVKLLDEDVNWQDRVQPDELTPPQLSDDPDDEEQGPVVENLQEALHEVKMMNRARQFSNAWAEVPAGRSASESGTWRQRHDSDEASPPRRSTVRHDSDDDSPPRRGAAHHDSGDDSPPRRSRARHDSDDDSPPRKRSARHDSDDESPPRKRTARHDSGDDSPPRRPPAPHASDDAPPPRRRTQRNDSDDESPPRRQPLPGPSSGGPMSTQVPRGQKSQLRAQHDSDDESPVRRGPPRRHDSDDDSPPRRGRVAGADASPPRRPSALSAAGPPRGGGSGAAATSGGGAGAMPPPPPRRPQGAGVPSMADGTSAGIVSAEQITKEMAAKREADRRRIMEMDASVSGRGAGTVHRIDGRKVSQKEYEELMKAKADAKRRKPKYIEEDVEWKGGLAQKRAVELEAQALEREGQKRFHRTFDEDADVALRRELRADDPMAAHMASKTAALASEHAQTLAQRHTGELGSESGFKVPLEVPQHSWIRRGVQPMANRYRIKPGRHWDGVHRSNGFEDFLFKHSNRKQADETDAYVYSEDL